jgi:hypothetical protein
MKNKTNNNNVYPNLSILSKWYSITALATPVAILMSAFIWILFIYLYLKDKEHHFIAMQIFDNPIYCSLGMTFLLSAPIITIMILMDKRKNIVNFHRNCSIKIKETPNTMFDSTTLLDLFKYVNLIQQKVTHNITSSLLQEIDNRYEQTKNENNELDKNVISLIIESFKPITDDDIIKEKETIKKIIELRSFNSLLNDNKNESKISQNKLKAIKLTDEERQKIDKIISTIDFDEELYQSIILKINKSLHMSNN